jgi:putative membrane protein
MVMMMASLGSAAGGPTWSAAGHAAATDPWFWAGVAGSALFALGLLVLVVRALLRRSRYSVAATFTEADRQAVGAALADAERKSTGEIVPVIVERSDRHPGAEWLAGLVVALVGTALLGFWLPWDLPLVVFSAQCSLGAVGFGLARALPDFKRCFITESRATALAQEQAFQEFFRNGMHKTTGATGVLIFVSLLEHRVVILADSGIDAKVDANFWADTDDRILDGIRAGSLRDGLIAGIRQAGDRLAEHFPWQHGDRNEIADRVIVRRE